MRSIKKTGIYSTKGFTLVELLIVVAIIGVLASQGVPAYRRMIQKSRKGEAQVMLGNIATAESGFFSEYGQYTNNIARAGAQLEGTNFIYASGFTDAGCAAQGVIQPTNLQVPNLPGNWNAGVPGPLPGGLPLTTAIGKVTNNVAAGLPRTMCQIVALPFGGNPAARAPGVAAGNLTYVAAATGNIVETTGALSSGCSRVQGVAGNIADCDAWYIDENRALANVNDGVK